LFRIDSSPSLTLKKYLLKKRSYESKGLTISLIDQELIFPSNSWHESTFNIQSNADTQLSPLRHYHWLILL